MQFKDFLNEAVQINHIDPEEDWDVAEQAEQIFKKSGILPDRTKDITIVALEGDQVVGGLASGWIRGDKHQGQETSEFSFDVAVDPQARNGSLVGPKLIEAGIKSYQQDQDGRPNPYLKLHVVNPKLAEYLKRKYTWDDEWSSSGDTFLTKY